MAFFDPPQPPRPGEPIHPNADTRPTISWRGMTFTPQMIVGAFVLLMGVLLTLDALTIIEMSRVTRLFVPLVALAGGTALLTRGRRGHRFWGFVLLVFGTSMLLNRLGLVQIGFWRLFWPLVLIAIGASVVWQTMRRGISRPADGATSPWVPRTGRRPVRPHLFAVMGEDKRAIAENPFRGGEMTAIMGGCVMDLRQATIPPGEEATIDVFGMMCGHEVHVPAGWIVTSRIVPVMGGVEDKRVLPPPAPDTTGAPAEQPPRLVLRGMVIMGGFVIKSAAAL